MPTQPQYEYIFNDEQLNNLCDKLDAAELIAIDTEFERRDTYYPILCLIQIADRGNNYIVDPQEISDFSSLQRIFENEKIAKIFHAAQEDFEVIYHTLGSRLHHVLDTQTAYSLIGENNPIGYQGLVEKLLDINIPKTESHSDWQQRPLTPDQITYAVQDVLYLEPCLQELQSKLTALGREDWPRKHGEWQSDPIRFTTRPEDAYKRMKHAWKQRPRELEILKALTSWVEQRAIDKNVPRNRVIRSEHIVNISEVQPKSLQQLRNIQGIPKHIVDRFGGKILSLVSSALDSAKDIDRDKFFADMHLRERNFKAVKKLIRAQCEILKIKSSIFTSRKALEELAHISTTEKPSREVFAKTIGEWQTQLIYEDATNAMENPLD